MEKLVLVRNYLDVMTDLIAYTGANIWNKQFYKTNMCYVHINLIAPLIAIQEELKQMGLQLLIIDAYRPLSVQKEIASIINDTRYVSDPSKSRHTRGTAIDVTLCDLHTGVKVEMQTDFSDFGPQCHAHKMDDISPLQLKNRTILQEVMTKHGFIIYEFEWWHFDFNNWSNDDTYPILDMSI
jgi:D-alanyl-D-alanine dipeptidase